MADGSTMKFPSVTDPNELKAFLTAPPAIRSKLIFLSVNFSVRSGLTEKLGTKKIRLRFVRAHQN